MTDFSAVQLAKLTAAIVGGSFKRSNSRAAALAKFQKAADIAGYKPADILAAANFDDAMVAVSKSVSIDDLHKSKHPKAVANAESWPKGKRARKAKGEAKAPVGKRAAIEAAAREGKLPTAPDFSAETHKRFRPLLAEVVDAVKARDAKALKAIKINPISSSPKAIAKYRDLALLAIEASA